MLECLSLGSILQCLLKVCLVFINIKRAKYKLSGINTLAYLHGLESFVFFGTGVKLARVFLPGEYFTMSTEALFSFHNLGRT